MRALLILAGLRLFAALPLPLNHTLGTALGWLLAYTPNALRHTTRDNLRRCFPELGARQRHRLARRSLAETGKTLTETGPLWYWPGERALALLREVRGRELLDEALRQGRGLILATPHLGAWELAGLWGAANLPMTTLYRRPRIAELDQRVREARERLGARYVAADAAGARALYQALADNRVVGMLPDQDPRDSGGKFAPFFGVPAYTMTFLSRLARKTGAPVLFAYCERLPRGRGYVLHFLPAPAAVHGASLQESLIAVNQAVEQCVRALPEQYQWSYKRFKTRPENIADRRPPTPRHRA
jgi:KDO2-lipid IV(A) lauroyltransferase